MARVEDGALHISSVQHQDAGEYYCTAENRAGRHQRRIVLTVTGMTISLYSPSSAAGTTGSTGSLPVFFCVACCFYRVVLDLKVYV